MNERCKHIEEDGFHRCGSYAFNLYKDDIDQGDLCDVHYWQAKAQRTEPVCPECKAEVLYECVACSRNNYPPQEQNCQEEHMRDLVYRLQKRAEIRRQISDRKSVQEGKPDRIADLLDEAADALLKQKNGFAEEKNT